MNRLFLRLWSRLSLFIEVRQNIFIILTTQKSETTSDA